MLIQRLLTIEANKKANTGSDGFIGFTDYISFGLDNREYIKMPTINRCCEWMKNNDSSYI